MVSDFPESLNIVTVVILIGYHNLTESGTSRSWGLLGVGISLLEEMCHCGVGL